MELLGESTCFNIKRRRSTLFIINREISRERNKFRTRPTDKYLEQIQPLASDRRSSRSEGTQPGTTEPKP